MNHDPEVDARYFSAKGDGGDKFTARTETLENRTVIIDYDAEGNIFGVEVL